jgi:hypothetical protein
MEGISNSSTIENNKTDISQLTGSWRTKIDVTFSVLKRDFGEDINIGMQSTIYDELNRIACVTQLLSISV